MTVCRLEQIADVGLGFKSLQNSFFYLEIERARELGIERQFLREVWTMDDFQTEHYLQTGPPGQLLFYCAERQSDLRGTAALKYIRSMGGRPAAAKKQTGQKQTIAEALAAQGGGLWYSPKALTHSAHVWLRKAFGGVFAPFIFEEGGVVDQRCNYVSPAGSVEWRIIAALAVSTPFALALESEGSASLGGGALEMATRQLRDLPVLDVRTLSARDKQEAIDLGRAVWSKEPVVDWLSRPAPGPNLQKLDEFFLSRIGASVSLDRLYADLITTCETRQRLADDKQTRTKAGLDHDVTLVATGIADSFRELFDGLRFPESFLPSQGETTNYQFTPDGPLSVECDEFMNAANVTVWDARGQVLIDKELPRAVGQVIVRALLLGRRSFVGPVGEESAEHVLSQYVRRSQPVVDKLFDACRASALGTKHENALFLEAVRILGISPEVLSAHPVGRFEVRGSG